MGAFGNPPMSSVAYLNEANENLLTIVQIETKEALSNVEEIAAVDGVDVLFVGPFDLGNSIGWAPPSFSIKIVSDGKIFRLPYWCGRHNS